MAYKGSQASAHRTFLPRGVKLFVNSFEIAEVRAIYIGREVEVTTNFIPADMGQRMVLRAIMNNWRANIRIVFPQGTEFIYCNRALTGGTDIDAAVQDAVSLRFWFGAEYSPEKDPADDGPEVGIIRRERRARVLDAFDTILPPPEGRTIAEPAGGGFTLVTEA